ncbi:deoxycytidylate deaminase-like [Plodia interpunctella]|uniref:deoxycytidylate deaminase-like n=1 Tax=Plodia interpunctella TaxID=58824 RepID=UPI0023683110|nr:deoxycytidylate deaminase-like [Plodia interpunctella]
MDPVHEMSKLSINGTMDHKREDYISWADYFMGLALLAAKRSKDPKTQVGACIVSEDKKIVGMGYNGMPTGCHDDDFPWGKNKDDMLEDKSMYVCHAEMNAIVNKNAADLKNCTIYTSLFPCNECAKIIVQSGIKTVVYMFDKDDAKYEASKIMFRATNIEYRRHTPEVSKIVIEFPTHKQIESP